MKHKIVLSTLNMVSSTMLDLTAAAALLLYATLDQYIIPTWVSLLPVIGACLIFHCCHSGV